MTEQAPLIFYDISPGPNPFCFAPNPWKSRYALNLKSVPYTTKWTALPTIPALRTTLNVPPSRYHASGEAYHTLPLLHDATTNTYVGDSFEIAVYLDRTYPSSGTLLFGPGTTALVAVFNQHVDALFSRFVPLCMPGLPFDPATAEQSRAEFARRARVASWDDLQLEAGEATEKLWAGFEVALGELARAWRFGEGGGGDGPFLEGERVGYADCVVAGWLSMFRICVGEKEWERVKGWQGGMWVRLLDAMGKWSEEK